MGLGIPELLIILIVVLIIFGPGKLPALGSGVGNALRNFRKAVNQPDAIDVTPEHERDARDSHAAQDPGRSAQADPKRSA
jgi:sec-independent protein translocase protein TatA